jgi:hypothetical protein
VNLAAPRYLQFPSTHAAYAYVQAQEFASREEARDRETNALIEAFRRVDMICLDSWSQTNCRRDLPLPAWRRAR